MRETHIVMRELHIVIVETLAEIKSLRDANNEDLWDYPINELDYLIDVCSDGSGAELYGYCEEDKRIYELR